MGVVAIRAEEYQLAGQDTGKGISIELSPYDIPREVEATFDKESGVLHIYFKYLDQEKSISKGLNDQMTLKVGQYSGKILGFEVEVKKYDIKKITLTVTDAIKAEIPRLQRFNQRKNYNLIESIIDKKRDAIFSDLATA